MPCDFCGHRRPAPEEPKPTVERCRFCELTPEMNPRVGRLMVVMRDGYPVSPGHTLIIPRRHVVSIFDLTPEEERAIWAEAKETKDELQREFNPDGFNVGFNDGRAAGQTVMHAHLHIIPRFTGDVADPRGGVRHCIPGKGFYTPRP